MLKNMTETEAQVWAIVFATTTGMIEEEMARRADRAIVLLRKQRAKANAAPVPAPEPEPGPWREPDMWQKVADRRVEIDLKTPINSLGFVTTDPEGSQDAVDAYSWAAKQYRARITELERVIAELKKRGGK